MCGLRGRDFDIDGIDEGREWVVVLVTTLRPEAKDEADDSCGRDGNEPRGDVETVVTVPGTDVELLVLFVAQLTGAADDVLIIDFHIASSFV